MLTICEQSFLDVRFLQELVGPTPILSLIDAFAICSTYYRLVFVSDLSVRKCMDKIFIKNSGSLLWRNGKRWRKRGDLCRVSRGARACARMGTGRPGLIRGCLSHTPRRFPNRPSGCRVVCRGGRHEIRLDATRRRGSCGSAGRRSRGARLPRRRSCRQLRRRALPLDTQMPCFCLRQRSDKGRPS
jgi:hypothetical protein